MGFYKAAVAFFFAPWGLGVQGIRLGLRPKALSPKP